jgi:hypothetical protein
MTFHRKSSQSADYYIFDLVDWLGIGLPLHSKILQFDGSTHVL